MSNTNAFLAWKADKLPHRLRSAVLHDNPTTLTNSAQNIERGNVVLKSWLTEKDGQLLSSDGISGYAMVPSQHLEELQDVQQRMGDAWSDTISFGVGLDLSEADRACRLASRRGGDSIIFYTDEVGKELDQAEDNTHKISSDASLKDLLNLDKADPQEMESNSVAGGGGFSPQMPSGAGPQTTPDQPISSASEHSEGEAAQNFMDENLPSGPSATNAAGDVAGQFHAAATQGAAEDDNARQQAQDAEGGGEINEEQLRGMIANILVKLKGQAPLLEQLKQQAPDAYEAINGVIKAMIVMARELINKPVNGEEKEEVKKSELEKAAQFHKRVRPAPPTQKTKPVTAQHSDASGPVKGRIPARFHSKKMQGGLGGINRSTYFLGKDKIFKLIPHPTVERAREYLAFLRGTKEENHPNIVPIHAAGYFGKQKHPNGGETHFTYEILKRLKSPPTSYVNDEGAFTHAGPSGGGSYSTDHLYEMLEGDGYSHGDLHSGNVMADTRGTPMAIDLESFLPDIRGGSNPWEGKQVKGPLIPGRNLVETAPTRRKVRKSELSKAVRSRGPFIPEKTKREDTTKNVAPIPGQKTKTLRVDVGYDSLLRGKVPSKNVPERKVNSSDNTGQGINRSTFFLGDDRIFKIIPHDSMDRARQYLHMMQNLKRLNLPHIVPIHAVGYFGARKDKWGRVTHHTYEILKRAHPARWNDNYEEPHPEVEMQDAIRPHGLRHGDLHHNNIMVNTKDDPVIIDLESFDPAIRMGRNPWGGKQYTGPMKPGVNIAATVEKPEKPEKAPTTRRGKKAIKKDESKIEPDPSKPVHTDSKLDKAAPGPMPESQVPPSGRVHRNLPAGNTLIEHHGNREVRKLKVNHVDPSGRQQVKHRQMESGMATPNSPEEAKRGRIHPISTLAPGD